MTLAQAQVALHQGNWEQAEQLFHQVLAQDPDSVDARQGLAEIAEARLHWQEAIQWYENALAVAENAEIHHRLAIVWGQLHQYQKARVHFEHSLRLAPTAHCHHNLALLLSHLNLIDLAHTHWQWALRLQPHWQEVRQLLASSYLEHGLIDESWQVIQTCPQEHYTADIWCLLGRIYETKGYFHEATQAYTHTLPEYAQNPLIWRRLAECFLAQGQHRKALEAASQCVTLDPTLAHRFKRLSLIPPPISQNQAEITHWRAELESEIAVLLDVEGAIAEDIPLTTPHFYLAYHGLNDRSLLTQLGQLYQRLLPFAHPHPMQQRPIQHIGIVSRHLIYHSVTHCFADLLKVLQQEGFHLNFFATPGLRPDGYTEHLKSLGSFYWLPNELMLAHQIMRQAELDLVIYLDIGMDAFSYFLAFGRAASYQCVLSGHPVTTGIPTMDYFISSTLLEPPGAQAHYSESLILLPDVLVNYKLPGLPKAAKSRAALGLPEHGHLYVCPMTLFKFHPDFDTVLAQLLRCDTNGHVILFQQPPFQTELQARFEHTIATHLDRLHFIPWAKPTDFLHILSHADVILDPFHFGAGNTAYLSFAVGTPVVTWPSAFLRGRVVAGLYQQMGITDGIAQDPEDYINQALMIANKSDYRHAISNQIQQKRSVIFDNQRGIQAFIEWIRSF